MAMAYHPHVVVVGSCMIDLISYAPRLPKSGETLHGNEFKVGFGGKGCNQLVAARKLGAECLLVARLGADSFGRDYLESLKNLGIPTEFVQITEGTSSGMAQIIVADSGENQIVIVGGANNQLKVPDVLRSEEIVKDCRVLLTQMEVPEETTVEALRIKAASKKGISIFNAAPAQSNLDPLLYSLPTIFCVNECEAALLTGLTVTTVLQAQEVVKELQNRGSQHVIITLGEEGAVYAAPGSSPVHIPGVPANVLDTTGAGDAFLGALAYFLSLSEEPNYLSCIKKANAVASISVGRPGTQTSFPTLQEVPTNLL